MDKSVNLMKMEYKDSLFSVHFSFNFNEFDTIELIFIVDNKVVYSDLLSVKIGQSEQMVSFPITEELNGRKLRIFYSLGFGKILIGTKILMNRVAPATTNGLKLILNSTQIKDIQRDYKSRVDELMRDVFN